MDDELYKALGRRAAMDNRSISQEVISIIENHLSSPMNQGSGADAEALKLAGSWDDARSPDEIASTIRAARGTGRFSGEF